MSDPAVIADQARYAEVGREYRRLGHAHELAVEWRKLRDDLEGARELLAEDGEDAGAPRGRQRGAEADRGGRGRDPPGHGRAGPERREERPGRDPRRHRWRRGGAVRRRPLQDAHPLRAGARLRGRGPLATRRPTWAASRRRRSRSRATARSRSSSSRAARTGSSGCRRRSPRGASTPRRRPWPSCPEAEEVEVEIDPNDLQVDVYRSSGPGGQSVNTTDSAVRITHKPSGIVVSMQDEKSQLQNREKAMRVLRARLYERKMAEQQAEIAAERKSQVGSGERSEKIRTYNYPQGRVTDHRVKLTAHNLEEILNGNLREFTDALAGRRSGRCWRRRRPEASSSPAASEHRRAKLWRRPPTRSVRRASTRRGSTLKFCSPTASGRDPRRCWWHRPRRRSIPSRRGPSPSSSGAAFAASRSPTSRAQGVSPHRAGGGPAGPDPAARDGAPGRAGARASAAARPGRRHRLGRDRARDGRRAA